MSRCRHTAAGRVRLSRRPRGVPRETDVGALRAVPVLVLAGTDDATIPAEDARRLAARIGPTADPVLVPGAGHMVPLTRAREVADALRGLMRRIPGLLDGRRRT